MLYLVNMSITPICRDIELENRINELEQFIKNKYPLDEFEYILYQGTKEEYYENLEKLEGN